VGISSKASTSYASNVYEVSVSFNEDLFEEAGYSIHEAVPKAIMEHLDKGDEEFLEIFPIYEPCRILSEGYEFDNGLVAEDFAISGSYNGGEMIIGQLVSSNSKEKYGGKPRDFIQAEHFEHQLRADQSIYPTLKSVYSIRTTIPEEEVVEAEERIRGELESTGVYELDLEVYEVEVSDKIGWEGSTSIWGNEKF